MVQALNYINVLSAVVYAVDDDNCFISVLAEDAIKAALNDYKKKNPEKNIEWCGPSIYE